MYSMALLIQECGDNLFLHLFKNIFMRIENEIKLGFKDVMIRPKRSTLKSRVEVSLARKFHFRHGGNKWEGIPVIAANMDTVGTFKMAAALAQHQLITAVHKHYSVEQWAAFIKSSPASITDNICISTGTTKADAEKLHQIISACPSLRFICIDVANGYSEHFVSFVKWAREKYPEKIIIAGNVVTGEMVEELLLDQKIIYYRTYLGWFISWYEIKTSLSF